MINTLDIEEIVDLSLVENDIISEASEDNDYSVEEINYVNEWN